uniref:Uncharacterized protein n=1 Tax=Arundo donax TaxID=35708 RepID=A0A0A9HLI1_ARUDO
MHTFSEHNNLNLKLMEKKENKFIVCSPGHC